MFPDTRSEDNFQATSERVVASGRYPRGTWAGTLSLARSRRLCAGKLGSSEKKLPNSETRSSTTPELCACCR